MRSTVNIGYSIKSLNSKLISLPESKKELRKNRENKELEKLTRSGECKNLKKSLFLIKISFLLFVVK